MPQATYQPAQQEDISTIFALSKSLIEQYETAEIDLDRVMRWMHRKITQSIGEYQRVMVDGQVAGYFHFHQDEGRMELDDLYILPLYQNQGLGTAVVTHCCAATELPVYLYVFIRNEGAVRLYQRMGFRVVETLEKAATSCKKAKANAPGSHFPRALTFYSLRSWTT